MSRPIEPPKIIDVGPDELREWIVTRLAENGWTQRDVGEGEILRLMMEMTPLLEVGEPDAARAVMTAALDELKRRA